MQALAMPGAMLETCSGLPAICQTPLVAAPPAASASQVRKAIGPIATPDVIHWAPGLPKTRSGKIMRRVLRKIAAKEEDQLGDTSTLADPGVVQVLLELRGK